MAAAEFLQTVESEVVAVHSFVSLLEREQEILIKGEIDELFELVRQKDGLAAQLATLASQRNRLLAASGLENDRAGMAAWFANHPEDTPARTAWATLLTIAGKARELNRVNGGLIHDRLSNNTLALETLLGSNATGNLYGPDGQSAAPSSRRISDSA